MHLYGQFSHFCEFIHGQTCMKFNFLISAILLMLTFPLKTDLVEYSD